MAVDPFPESNLIDLLRTKSAERRGVAFNFLAQLESLRDRVTAEVTRINVLFPEYTPHDANYHLKRLFPVADTVLGRERLEAFNSAELFILAAALYGHDWGMAVSEAEKDLVLTGSTAPDVKAEDLWLLPDERLRLKKFAKEKGLPLDARGHTGEMAIEHWREYVRQTHAFRSGVRVQRFFEAADGGVAEAVRRVCEGHWLDFPLLESADAYPADFSVLRESVNLRALACYLRLIDLLDLAEDRTPYVLWKFVAPRDPRSRMEWAKHRALQSVTSAPLQEGRILRVDGGTDDHEVYAALEDLKGYCNDQFHGVSELLGRMNDPRHHLDVYRIEWRLAARGFQPVSIQFEFDRTAMFEILGNEIYQGDPYVFLRELLQNSIDATRMRREVLKRRGLGAQDLWMIFVDVEHGTDGDAVVTWRDDGIGMDEHVVRNYLAVAGRSYYQSEDFERENLVMDPISRFGVGLLSCFMVAERIEIETYRDPYLPPASKALAIAIPAVDKRFRIEERSVEDHRVGTVVRVFVEGRKLPAKEGEPPQPLDVTGYLSIVAGFVEFPIVVVEGERKTVILHPKHDPAPVLSQLGRSFQVQQKGLTFPWQEAIVPQDLATALGLLREERLDLETDLKLDGHEGVIVFPVQADGTVGLLGNGVELNVATSVSITICRQLGEWRARSGLSRSGSHSSDFVVFKDGILLSEAPMPETEFLRHFLQRPFVTMNLTSNKERRVDLSRSNVISLSDGWDATLRSAFVAHFSRWRDSLLALPLEDRFIRLGQLMALRGLTSEEVFSFFPIEALPVPTIQEGGVLDWVEWRELANGSVNDTPAFFGSTSQSEFFPKEEIDPGVFKGWRGEAFLFVFDFFEVSTEAANRIVRRGIERSHRPGSLRFLTAPWEVSKPLAQVVLCPYEGSDQEHSLDTELEMVLAGTIPADPRLLSRNTGFGSALVLDFLPPFASAFLCNSDYRMYLNRMHPMTLRLFQIAANGVLGRREKSLSAVDLGRFADAQQLPDLSGGGFAAGMLTFLKRLDEVAKETGMLPSGADLLVERSEIVEAVSGPRGRARETFGQAFSSRPSSSGGSTKERSARPRARRPSA